MPPPVQPPQGQAAQATGGGGGGSKKKRGKGRRGNFDDDYGYNRDRERNLTKPPDQEKLNEAVHLLFAHSINSIYKCIYILCSN